ncbi:MAG: phosphoribosylformimino-5-aminoimidazole carboxamide ribotide isomerase [Halanaerobium sp. 4-GBenrich]|jgi:phosphoribosylformimino-5-aminoimidazole carboxamide ribotide isomerase|uniref:1-(5-phosphoribosyl)-5-[(5-phosphoribosylamino)methylideneamino] imidazole-4-carboxamide isomerase n=1 Tax=Halanaerobium congolense TaxID=54121 RepID=A0A4R7E0L9_9FIRM|nr:1-(5-phosphoribosyl)-5-[(5-phosphoribosylamino)methylideneamino]imidazole-4-carboxamide isomerase [Halanaerobium congolense]KXS48994.1 MAG: phosphoribosylformimino-5-aminoimidazole carboxamide ribotide isomerase [Halanaerobium sp. T82-1]ODS50267.1 MAG: phosphoribosylformimino-5-aminoimidazole carboxamide ribotide isomerase [Halanaerobium sp. 4-GBenrich]TDP09433.1 1-(5-phosphoribosyl)-5-[(5-phosphoribosylamino)methylideneamino] imidazole-4-carboxamide isomerase [Halanaerobium congolense]TDS26
MIVLPAIDLKSGEVVRLKQGDFERKTVYSQDPLAVAEDFAAKGAEWLHLVDLDGAAVGESQNYAVIKKIAAATDLKIQTGGGIRKKEDVKRLLDIGVKRAIIGTLAVKDPELLAAMIRKFGAESILVSIDARDGKVATSGWLEASEKNMLDFAREMEALGVKYILYTDISRDGMLKGPDFTGLRKLKAETELKIIASGGISSNQDLYDLAAEDFYGAITGQAIYQAKVDLEEVLKKLGENNA